MLTPILVTIFCLLIGTALVIELFGWCETAYDRGYQAGSDKHPRQMNPYSLYFLHGSWDKGWQAGYIQGADISVSNSGGLGDSPQAPQRETKR